MAQRVSLGIALGVVVACVAGPAHRAQACGASTCVLPAFFPSRGTLPANLEGFYWWPARHFGTPDDALEGQGVRLARIDGAQPELIEVTLEPLPMELTGREGFLVIPSTPFVEGARYAAWDDACRYEPFGDVPPEQPADESAYEPGGYLPELYQSAAFIAIGPAAPLPSALGELSATEPAAGYASAAGGAGCSETGDAVVSELRVELSASAEPWREALFYETRVDGDRYDPIGNFLGNEELVHAFAGYGIDRVFAMCEELSIDGEGVDEGRHEARMRARVPGMDEWLVTDAESFELRCAPRPDDGGVVGHDGSVFEADAATPPPPSRPIDGDPTSDESSRLSSDGGCACSATPSRGLFDTSLIAFALLLLAQRRGRASS